MSTIRKAVLVSLVSVEVLFSQLLFHFGTNRNFIFGYNHNVAEVWKYHFFEKEEYNEFDYGFAKVDNFDFRSVWSNNFVVGCGWAFKKFELWFYYYFYDLRDYQSYKIASNDYEMYYLRVWDSVIFPLLNTDHSYYASPQYVRMGQAISWDVYSAGAEFKKFKLYIKYIKSREEEFFRLDEFAKIYDYFYNHVYITDVSKVIRNFYIVEFKYSPKFYFAGVGFGLENSKIENKFIDIDDGYFNAKDGSSTPFYYHGIVSQNLRLKNVVFYFTGGVDFKFKVEKRVYLGFGFEFYFYPYFIYRYNLIYPWGVGLSTNTKTGMKWQYLARSLVISNINLFSFQIKL